MAGSWVDLLDGQWHDEMSSDEISLPYHAVQTFSNVGVYVTYALPEGMAVTKVRGAGTIDVTSMPAGTEGGFYLDEGIYQPLTTGLNTIVLPETDVGPVTNSTYGYYFETNNDGSSDVDATFNLTQLDVWVEEQSEEGAKTVLGTGWVSLLDLPWKDQDGSDATFPYHYSGDPTAAYVTSPSFNTPDGTVTKIRAAGTYFDTADTVSGSLVVKINGSPPTAYGGESFVSGETAFELGETPVSGYAVPMSAYFGPDGGIAQFTDVAIDLTQFDVYIDDGGSPPQDGFWTDLVGCTDTGGSTATYTYDFPDYLRDNGDFAWSDVAIASALPYIPTVEERVGQILNYGAPDQSITLFKAWGYGGGNQLGVDPVGGHLKTTSPVPPTSAVTNPWVQVNYLLPDAPPSGYSAQSIRAVILNGWFAVTSDAAANVQYELGDDVYVATNKTGGHNSVNSTVPLWWNGSAYDTNTYLRVLSGDIGTTSLELDLSVQVVMAAQRQMVAKLTNVLRDGVPFGDLVVYASAESDGQIPETLTPSGRFVIEGAGGESAATYTGDLQDADGNQLGSARWINTYTPF